MRVERWKDLHIAAAGSDEGSQYTIQLGVLTCDVLVCEGFMFWTELALTQSFLVFVYRSTAQRKVEAARCCRSRLGSAGWRDRPTTSSMLCYTEKVKHARTHTRTFVGHFITFYNILIV